MGYPVIKRVYNNNVLLAQEEDGSEVVLLGKGIAFRRKVGELVEPVPGMQRFVPDGTYPFARIADVLKDAPPEQVAVATEVTAIAHEVLGLQPRQSLMLPILDHLAFAVRRAATGSVVDFPLRWEVAQLYPAEAALGRRVLELVNGRLGLRLQEDEWVAFALHFVNQQWAVGDISKTVAMTKVIAACFSLLESRWERTIDQNAMSATRFVTHVRYVFARASTESQLRESPIDVLTSFAMPTRRRRRPQSAYRSSSPRLPDGSCPERRSPTWRCTPVDCTSRSSSAGRDALQFGPHLSTHEI